MDVRDVGQSIVAKNTHNTVQAAAISQLVCCHVYALGVCQQSSLRLSCKHNVL